ncbi:hypothetical protein ACRAWD_18080 [Caulobacter segnis]
MLDINGVVTNWNRGAERIKGYAGQRHRGPAFLDLLYPGIATPAGPLWP